MPELPEIETICKALRKTIIGKSISKIDVNKSNLRRPVTDGISKILKNVKIKKIERKAKYVVWHMNNDMLVIIHLGMSGKLTHNENAKEFKKAKHDHILFYFDNGTMLAFNDPLRLGMVVAIPISEEDEFFQDQGIEPLTDKFDCDKLKEIVGKTSANIKSVLMNNKLIAGIGNIYACESLYAAKISPFKSANKLTNEECEQLVKEIKNVLNEAIQAGGSTLRDYSQISGEPGYFQNNFKVYSKSGTACEICNNNISSIKQNGRTTHYCKTCQK